MNKEYLAKASMLFHISPKSVWDALTNPDLIKQYLFGTEVNSEWKVGGPIRYSGVWEGKPYEDKGTILVMEPEHVLVTTYWSSFSGLADVPENYQTVRYEITSESGGTRLTITQDNNDTPEAADRAETNWKSVLVGMKALLEG
jgi:uncharacterized protein YndB with AHSA1/START domain